MAGGQGPAYEGIEVMPESRGIESGGALQPNTGQHGYYVNHNDVPSHISPNGRTAPSLARRKKTVFCLTTREAGFVLVILMLVIAGSVGGGVGGTIAAKHQSQNKSPLETLSSSQTISVAGTSIENSSSFPTALVTKTNTESSSIGATSTTSSAASAESIDAAGCPASNGTTYTSNGSVFIKLCQIDITATGLQYYLQENEIKSSLDDCIDFCTAWSESNPGNECLAVAWDIYVPGFSQNNQRCWLKNYTTVLTPNERSFQVMASAILI
ncbi:uncharacterized protein BDZ99DRAFT_503269 [Mytilinidion resinicola]|uniref:Apple domain-containing protein n=1 Tax=Mytilinidion resinicola TaxID=574789 RepID=A0A6A6Y4F1_9PEZI|nr:uncharacterized protein BDZ99DRAFT_503269 [Mytilinidion resinicola]KAF2803676.1 hypothetical protein BDZ99DRAFT_503269 [Mytilinidion resinicola]